jgi:lipid II:glycine glycyltransferase (peptidoglycan interpeptide bridge formation enzyme)
VCALGTVFHAVSPDGDVVSAALMLLAHGTAYYHWAGNSGFYPKSGANDLLVDAMATEAKAAGCKRFHLGGGATSAADDAVLFFKSGFSDLRAPAVSYFRVFDEAAYRKLCAEKVRREVDETGAEFNTSFEPIYRREIA